MLWIEDIAAWPDHRVHAQAQCAPTRRAAPFLLIVGLAFLLLSFYSGQKMLRLEFSGLRASGAVRSFEISHPGSRSMAFYPVVEFSTAARTRIRFRDDAGSNPPPYHVGEAVPVLYLPESPQHAIIDRGLWNGLPSIAVFLLGSLSLYVSVRIFRLPQPAPG